MTKTSTIHFTINNLASKAKGEFIDRDSAFECENEYAEIFEMLEDMSLDVRQEVVDQILAITAQHE
ncbi:MAG: hypothetical protein JW801_10370 [Bacteroidales bacterium]|nr:hypothetical protein [Bacteroidales bacterium]